MRQVRERRLRRDHDRKVIALAAASAAVEAAADQAEAEAEAASEALGKKIPVRTASIEAALEAEECLKIEEAEALRLLCEARAVIQGSEHTNKFKKAMDQEQKTTINDFQAPEGCKTKISKATGISISRVTEKMCNSQHCPFGSSDATGKSKKKVAAFAVAEAVVSAEGPAGAT